MELSQTTTVPKQPKQSEVRVQLDLLQKEVQRNGELKDQFKDRLSPVLRDDPTNMSPDDEKDKEQLTPLASELRNMVSNIKMLNNTWEEIHHSIEL